MHRLKRALHALSPGRARPALYALAACALLLGTPFTRAAAQDRCTSTTVDAAGDTTPCLERAAPVLTNRSVLDAASSSLQIYVDAVDAGANFTPTTARGVWFDGAPVVFTTEAASISGHTLVGKVTSIANGVHSLRVRDCDRWENCADQSWDYSLRPELGLPNLSAHNGENLSLTTGSATLSYATPAYVSLGQSRSIGLVYSSALAAPRALLRVRVGNDGSSANQYAFSLKRPDNTAVTLTGGLTEVFYTNGPGTGALQFDASNLATGAYSYTLVLRRYFDNGTTTETSAPARVLVINEKDSPVGAGWYLAGVQRLYIQSDGIVVAGDGTAAFFAKNDTGWTSPAGDFTTLTFNGTSYLRKYPDGTVVHYGANGLSNGAVDRFGNTTMYTWSTNALGAPVLISVTDPVGHVTQLAYSSTAGAGYGKLSTITDPTGRVTRLSYTGGTLTSIEGPDRTAALGVQYQPGTNLLDSWTDRSGTTTKVAYDAAGMLARITGATVTVGAPNRPKTVSPVTTIESLATSVLPQSGYGTKASPALAASGPWPVAPGNDVRIRVTNPRGIVTETWLNRFDLPANVQEYDATQVPTRSYAYQYDAHGRPVAARTNGLLLTETRYSDDRANPFPVRSVNKLTGEVTEYTQLVSGGLYLPWIESGADYTVERTYSGTPLAPTSTRTLVPGAGIDATTSVTYDSRGRAVTVTDPQGRVTTYSYQPTGFQNLASVTRPTANGQGTTSFGYDAVGRTTAVTNPLDQTTRTEYDALNRVISTTRADGKVTRYGVDYANRTSTVTDPRGQVYTTRTNALGWVTSETDPRGGTSSYFYNVTGTVAATISRRGDTISYEYDDWDRLKLVLSAQDTIATYAYSGPNTWMTLASNAPGADTTREQKIDWVASSTRSSVDTTRFDALGRIVQAVTRRGLRRYVVDYAYPLSQSPSYNPFNRRATMAVTLDGGTPRVTEFSWAPDSVRAFGHAVALNRDAHGVLRTTTYSPSGLGFSYGYYADGSLASQVGTMPEVNRGYTRDRLGRAIATAYQDFTRMVAYDTAGRLSRSQDQIDNVGVLRQAQYTYDAVGNRTDRGAVVGTGNLLTQFDGYTIAYDANGSITSWARPAVQQTFAFNSREGMQREFQWNAVGQLTRVRTGTGYVSYGYDGNGRRVRKTIGDRVMDYVYAGDDLVAEVDYNLGVQREYAYFPGTDRPLAMRDKYGQVLFYQQDGPGNVTTLVDSNNQIRNEYRYDPWGQLIDAPQVPVMRLTTPNSAVHVYTLDATEQNTTDGGLSVQGIGFYLRPEPTVGHVELFSCIALESSGRFLSTDAGCAGKAKVSSLGYAATVRMAGTVPLYAFEKSAYNYFYTTDAAEAQQVRSWGWWRDAGIAAYVYPVRSAPARVAIQRLYNGPQHRYTVDATDPTNSSGGFRYEGVGFYLEGKPRGGHVPFYSCLSATTDGRFISSDPGCNGGRFDGLLGYVATTRVVTSTPLYAFEKSAWNYFYTADSAEAQRVRTRNVTWRDAGIVGYVYTSTRPQEQAPQPLRYTGREYDEDTGLYQYRARWYDPHLGRFLSEDPTGLDGGINPSAYVGNDPVNNADPSGLCSINNGHLVNVRVGDYGVDISQCDWSEAFRRYAGEAFYDRDSDERGEHVDNPLRSKGIMGRRGTQLRKYLNRRLAASGTTIEETVVDLPPANGDESWVGCMKESGGLLVGVAGALAKNLFKDAKELAAEAEAAAWTTRLTAGSKLTGSFMLGYGGTTAAICTVAPTYYHP